ncbi:hypothetical protein HOE04_04350 [archaeon]|nr:hypothetical protein [archaeon]
MIKKGVNKRRALHFIAIIFSTLLLTSLIAAASDVAYIYKRSNAIDKNILKAFSEMDLDVDLIKEKNLPNNLEDYKLIFVGDERFKFLDDFPVYNYRSVIMNSYYGEEWGLSDDNGVNKLTSNYPLSVKLVNDGAEKVYTRATERGHFIPYYYLPDCESEFESIARTWAGGNNRFSDVGDVVAFASSGTDLAEGKVSKENLCFYGIAKTDYWTNNAKDLFKDCVNYAGSVCEEDSDCGDDDFVGDKFCKEENLYQNYREFDCENQGTAKSDCTSEVDSKLVENCEYGCDNGECLSECTKDSDCNSNEICNNNNECVEVICKTNQDCNDNNQYTYDTCTNPGTIQSNCNNEPITCLYDADCDDNNQFTQDTCTNPGTPQSSCNNQEITCFNDLDCDDNDAYTFDECENKGTINSYCSNTEINCINNNDCGFTGFTGDEFCKTGDVFKNYRLSTCNNPGTKQSFCTSVLNQELISECADQCLDGACVEITCNSDNDCNDNNQYTQDTCTNPGTIQSNCENKPIECIEDTDCDDNNQFTQDTCTNPGTIQSNCENEPITCFQNSDCGYDGFIGETTCNQDDVFQNYKSFECINQGTTSSSCSQTIEPRLIETCADTCIEGGCVEITCYSNQDCDDQNPSTVDTCNNPGEVDSYCSYGDITCFQHSDCGTNQYVGDSYCDQGDIYKNLKIFMCNNPATIFSFCSDNTSPKLINTCEYGCTDGSCIRCDSNSDCDDQDSSTEDTCRFAGTIESYCENEPITCFQDSDCGTINNIMADYFCIGKDVYENYQEFNCENPGTKESSCSSDTLTRFITSCQYGCFNGECLESNCEDNDQDNYDTCNPGETGDDGNPADCNDNNENINPGATEICDGIDNDCNALTSDGLSEPWLNQITTCGTGECSNHGNLGCINGAMFNSCSPTAPSQEICNNLDDDCDGQIDENNVCSTCEDNDQDNYDTCNPGETGDDGNPADCNDNNENINPGATEICNEIDDNCNGQIDENNVCSSECSDGLDNDNDEKIDALVEVKGTGNREKSWYGEIQNIRTFVNEKAELYGYTKIPTSFYGQGFVSNDYITAKKVCELAGYESVEFRDCNEDGNSGRCIFTTPQNNFIGVWNPSINDFEIISAVGKTWLASLTCVDSIPESDCNDNIDNDNDGKIDYPEDDGCDSLRDNSEIMHDPQCSSLDDDSEEGTASECQDGLDNDNDGKIDALIEVQGTLNNEISWYAEMQNIRAFVNEKSETFGYTQIPTSFDGQGMVSNDATTAEKVCQLAGYENVKHRDCRENGNYGRCIFTTTYDNFVGVWNPSDNDFEIISSTGETWLASLTCRDQIPESDCNDNIDNDNDGKIDYPEDDGCDSLRDDSEIMHDPQCYDENDSE